MEDVGHCFVDEAFKCIHELFKSFALENADTWNSLAQILLALPCGKLVFTRVVL